MNTGSFTNQSIDKSNPLSIYDYSRHLIGHTLREMVGEEALNGVRKGKGGLGQMVEELFFGYDVNSNREADFSEAGVELKCTPLLKSASNDAFRIKERLVCTMIDYFELVDTNFEDSHLVSKCRLMLLLFYLHVSGTPIYDYEFIYRILWQIPEKDLLLIKKDYETIAQKVRRGEAHLLSEGDTVYLGACRKGQKGDSPQKQPFSDIRAYKRAFSLKPAYMRYILNHVIESGKNHFTNYTKVENPDFELVTTSDLKHKNFETIIIDRFKDFVGLDYVEICNKLNIIPYQAKGKYADVCALIASNSASKRLSHAEEFVKSGIVMKTVRVGENGMPKEAMSFKNIDYCEVYENSEWVESELYEIFTNKFLFVVFKPVKGQYISLHKKSTDTEVAEQKYVLDKVFFWTMPNDDVEHAKTYWEHIHANVMSNKFNLDDFWRISDKRKFHVRPKATKKTQLAINPNGGKCAKYCYWFNADYVKQIIDGQD